MAYLRTLMAQVPAIRHKYLANGRMEFLKHRAKSPRDRRRVLNVGYLFSLKERLYKVFHKPRDEKLSQKQCIFDKNV